MDKIPYKRILLYVLILVAILLLFPLRTKADLEAIPIIVAQPVPVVVQEVPKPHVEGVKRAKKPLTALQLANLALITSEFPDAPIMVKIAEAESTYNATAKNPKSSASGLFQILTSTWKGAGCQGDVFDAESNIACARKLYTTSGTKPWDASKATWGQYLNK